MSIAQLRTALEHIKANPDEWDQSTWFCGTAACLAGHIVLRDGWEPIDYDHRNLAYHISKDGAVEEVDAVASRILGIMPIEGAVLWDSRNTLQSLETHTHRLEADRAIYPSAFFPRHAWQHCWTDATNRVQVAAHRRTSYVRIGGCVRIEDWDSRAEALDYAEACAQGRLLTYHHNYDLRTLAAA